MSCDHLLMDPPNAQSQTHTPHPPSSSRSTRLHRTPKIKPKVDDESSSSDSEIVILSTNKSNLTVGGEGDPKQYYRD